MARKEPDPPHELDPLKGGLKHNPFAVLRSKVVESDAGQAPSSAPAKPPAPAKPAAPAKQAAPANTREQPPAKRAPKIVTERVSVRIERTGRGGKTVTIAEGPGFAGRPPEPLARDIARGMGTGARVEGAAIVVQGDQRERLVAWLAERGFVGAVAGN